jgi:hypothetical protein
MPRGIPRFVDRAALRERVTAMLTPADEAGLPDPAPGTDEYQVISWLARLHLLHGVPFAYLVPDIRILPAESIRFFRLDNGWVEALLDGAFSIGATRATADAGAVLRSAAADAARARLRRVRAELIPSEADPEPTDPEVISGFLLRSAVVPGWPRLEVRAYADVEGKQPLPLLRLDRVASSLLCCLAAGVLRRVDIREPPEGIHFGVDPGTLPGRIWEKQLRYASGDATTPVGSWIPGAVQRVTLRPETASVLRVDALAQAMAPRVWTSQLPGGEAPSPAQFTAAHFGLEMVEGVATVSFQLEE